MDELFTPNIELTPLALALREYRIEHDMTHEQVAIKLGISPRRVFAFENGQATPVKWEYKRLQALLSGKGKRTKKSTSQR